MGGRLIRHEATVFEDAVVCLTGHAWHDCTFRRCTLIWRGPPTVIDEDCVMDSCTWIVDLTLASRDDAEELQRMANAAAKTLPA